MPMEFLPLPFFVISFSLFFFLVERSLCIGEEFWIIGGKKISCYYTLDECEVSTRRFESFHFLDGSDKY